MFCPGYGERLLSHLQHVQRKSSGGATGMHYDALSYAVLAFDDGTALLHSFMCLNAMRNCLCFSLLGMVCRMSCSRLDSVQTNPGIEPSQHATIARK